MKKIGCTGCVGYKRKTTVRYERYFFSEPHPAYLICFTIELNGGYW